MSDSSLVYVSDDMPGIRRVRRGPGFAYRSSEGQWLRDAAEIQRIRRLAIPPAYSEVWICPLPNGHLQATGRDARGRKQYRYHADWSAARDAEKFDRLAEFGRALPHIRARVARDLRALRGRPLLPRELVLATIVRLLDTTFVRVGNDEYARGNGSYGLTTLRNPHAKVEAGRLRLRFRGKSGVEHDVSVQDPRLAQVVRRCQHLPGQELFQYQDEDGAVHRVGSTDVNSYLSEAAGAHFTAKDFRTWHASVLALELGRQACAGGVQPFPAKQLLAEVAAALHNTPAVCRKAYIHPRILALWQELAAAAPGEAQARLCQALPAEPRPGARRPAAEQRLLAFLAGKRRRRRRDM
ncbi:DNA topoisomerase IB [Roseateles violae]|uniref:DNA topoisomerase n=1 Tax=Roseateles violae TaxID=3058042 RepID=A0ABT8DQ62_9BURK|nr:DNA topoisomerase IB [Pelomonas sp. PFR6]MDN3920486.1 DNA topoisomerase IB [Pelomonas sp. PFR6]